MHGQLDREVESTCRNCCTITIINYDSKYGIHVYQTPEQVLIF
jgi:hypothetical protein